MMEQCYSRCHSDHCVYFKRLDNGRYIILLLYVDDLVFVGSNIEDINVLKWKLAKSFAIKDLSNAKQIFGMRITRDRKNHNLTLSQGEHIEKLFEIFKLQNAKPLSTPFVGHFKQSKETCPYADEEIEYMSKVLYSLAVGTLMYGMVCTRQDIVHAMGVVRRCIKNPCNVHCKAVQWIFEVFDRYHFSCFMFWRFTKYSTRIC